eukprot:8527009-Alexandrium_andersonii.AAC.1
MGMDGRDVADLTCHSIQAPEGLTSSEWEEVAPSLRQLEGSVGPLSAITVYDASDLEGAWVVPIPHPAIPAAIASMEPQRDLLGARTCVVGDSPF